MLPPCNERLPLVLSFHADGAQAAGLYSSHPWNTTKCDGATAPIAAPAWPRHSEARGAGQRRNQVTPISAKLVSTPRFGSRILALEMCWRR